MRDRIDRRLVPGAAVLKHRIEDDIVATEPGAPRLGAPEAPFNQLSIVSRQAGEGDSRRRFENQVRRLCPAVHRAHLVARPEDNPFLNLLASCGLQPLVGPIEGEIAGDVSVVIHLGDAYLAALEKFAIEPLGGLHGPIRLLAILA